VVAIGKENESESSAQLTWDASSICRRETSGHLIGSVRLLLLSSKHVTRASVTVYLLDRSSSSATETWLESREDLLLNWFHSRTNKGITAASGNMLYCSSYNTHSNIHTLALWSRGNSNYELSGIKINLWRNVSRWTRKLTDFNTHIVYVLVGTPKERICTPEALHGVGNTIPPKPIDTAHSS
jgi:hypothetical protein